MVETPPPVATDATPAARPWLGLAWLLLKIVVFALLCLSAPAAPRLLYQGF